MNARSKWFLPALAFFSCMSASQGLCAEPQKIPATTLVERKMDFLWLLPCTHDNKKGVCIAKKVPPGQEITVLGNGKNELCRVKSTSMKAMIEDEDQMSEASLLMNVDCKAIPYHVRGIMGRPVSDYQELSYRQVTDAAVTELIEKGMKKLAASNVTPGERPLIFKYPHPTADIYFAHYSDLSPLVAVVNGDVRVIAQGQHGCCKDGDAFILNGEYYAQISTCSGAEFEQMVCGNKIFLIKSAGRQKIN